MKHLEVVKYWYVALRITTIVRNISCLCIIKCIAVIIMRRKINHNLPSFVISHRLIFWELGWLVLHRHITLGDIFGNTKQKNWLKISNWCLLIRFKHEKACIHSHSIMVALRIKKSRCFLLEERVNYTLKQQNRRIIFS